MSLSLHDITGLPAASVSPDEPVGERGFLLKTALAALPVALQERLGPHLWFIAGARTGLVWPDSGGLLELRDGRALHWVLVDPFGGALPTVGSLPAEDAAAFDGEVAPWCDAVQATAATPIDVPAFEALAATTAMKLEWRAGRIYAMAGGTITHSLIVGNVHGILWSRRPRGCVPFIGSETYLQDESWDSYRHTDVMLICGPREPHSTKPHAVTNPVLIVEVVSPSSRKVDHQDKLTEFQTIDALRVYLIVDATRREVTVHRLVAGSWQTEHPNTTIDLVGGLTVTVDELYADTDL